MRTYVQLHQVEVIVLWPLIATPTNIAIIPQILVRLRNRTVERVHRQMDACPAYVTIPYQRVQQKKTMMPYARLPVNVFRAIANHFQPVVVVVQGVVTRVPIKVVVTLKLGVIMTQG